MKENWYPTASEIIAFPSWIPPEAWDGWVLVRRLKKWPMTPNCVTLTINKLAALRQAGHDPRAVLNRSEVNCWRSVFPLPPEPRGQSGSDYANEGYWAAKCREVGVTRH